MNYDKIIQGALECKNYDDLSAYLNTIYKEIYTADFLDEFSKEVWAGINKLELQESILHFVEWDHFTGAWIIRKPKDLTSSSSIFAGILYWLDEREKYFGHP